MLLHTDKRETLPSKSVTLASKHFCSAKKVSQTRTQKPKGNQHMATQKGVNMAYSLAMYTWTRLCQESAGITSANDPHGKYSTLDFGAQMCHSKKHTMTGDEPVPTKGLWIQPTTRRTFIIRAKHERSLGNHSWSFHLNAGQNRYGQWNKPHIFCILLLPGCSFLHYTDRESRRWEMFFNICRSTQTLPCKVRNASNLTWPCPMRCRDISKLLPGAVSDSLRHSQEDKLQIDTETSRGIPKATLRNVYLHK